MLDEIDDILREDEGGSMLGGKVIILMCMIVKLWLVNMLTTRGRRRKWRRRLSLGGRASGGDAAVGISTGAKFVLKIHFISEPSLFLSSNSLLCF